MDIIKFENKLWLATPTMHGEKQHYIQEVFDTNWVSTVGENLTALEEGISKKVGCKQVCGGIFGWNGSDSS